MPPHQPCHLSLLSILHCLPHTHLQETFGRKTFTTPTHLPTCHTYHGRMGRLRQKKKGQEDNHFLLFHFTQTGGHSYCMTFCFSQYHPKHCNNNIDCMWRWARRETGQAAMRAASIKAFWALSGRFWYNPRACCSYTYISGETRQTFSVLSW